VLLDIIDDSAATKEPTCYVPPDLFRTSDINTSTQEDYSSRVKSFSRPYDKRIRKDQTARAHYLEIIK